MSLLPRLACLLAGLATAAAVAAQPAPSPAVPVAPTPRAKKLTDAEITRLIARVGSPSFAEREAATEELRRRYEALPAVERALATATNPEVARRLGSVLAGLKRDWANRRLAKLPEYVKHRQFDRLVETMVLCREYLTEEHDKHVRAFIQGVYAEATSKKYHGPTADNWSDFQSFAWSNRPGYSRTGTPSIVAFTAPTLSGRGTGVIAADWIRPPAPGESGTGSSNSTNSTALCNGDVEVNGQTGGVLIATGDVRIHSSLDIGLVISLGNVFIGTGGYGAVVVSRGDVTWRDDLDACIIRSRDSDFFRNWRLFSGADLGVELVSAFGNAIVTKVADGTPASLAGFRCGDRIVEIDGVAVRSSRETLKLFCRASVNSGESKLVIVRGNDMLRITVRLQSW